MVGLKLVQQLRALIKRRPGLPAVAVWAVALPAHQPLRAAPLVQNGLDFPQLPLGVSSDGRRPHCSLPGRERLRGAVRLEQGHMKHWVHTHASRQGQLVCNRRHHCSHTKGTNAAGSELANTQQLKVAGVEQNMITDLEGQLSAAPICGRLLARLGQLDGSRGSLMGSGQRSQKKKKTTTTSELVVGVKGGAGRVRAEPETSPYHQSKDWVTWLSASISVRMLALLAPLGVHDAVHVGGRMHM